MSAPLRITVRIAGQLLEAELPPEALEELRQALAPASPRPVPMFLSADEAAAILRCRKRRVYELVADGRLSRHGEGRRLLLSRVEVESLARGR